MLSIDPTKIFSDFTEATIVDKLMSATHTLKLTDGKRLRFLPLSDAKNIDGTKQKSKDIIKSLIDLGGKRALEEIARLVNNTQFVIEKIEANKIQSFTAGHNLKRVQSMHMKGKKDLKIDVQALDTTTLEKICDQANEILMPKTINDAETEKAKEKRTESATKEAPKLAVPPKAENRNGAEESLSASQAPKTEKATGETLEETLIEEDEHHNEEDREIKELETQEETNDEIHDQDVAKQSAHEAAEKGEVIEQGSHEAAEKGEVIEQGSHETAEKGEVAEQKSHEATEKEEVAEPRSHEETEKEEEIDS